MTLDPLAQLSVFALVATLLIFVLALFALRRRCLVPLTETMQRRADRIAAARAGRNEAEQLVAGARAEAESVLAAARSDAATSADVLHAELAAARADALASARGEADAVLARGREEIGLLRVARRKELGDALVSCVTEAVRGLAGTVDEGRVRLAVDEVLATARDSG